MKRLCVLWPLFFVILSCTRDWNNPFETDSDLSHPPLITNIQLDNSNRLMLYLDYSYSSDCTLLFERKSASAFDPVNLLPITTSVYADTTLDMEQNYNLVYRLRVQKNGYTSDYSNEKQFSYVSNVLNAPTGLTCSSIELQGVRLNWLDNSSKETGFKIEKNVNGSGFAEAADLPANTTTWLDAISGMPDPPQSIIYRIRAYNNNLNSSWSEQNVIYSGLGAPSNLHITNSHFWEFTFAWSRNSTIATGYQIERRKDSGAWSVVGSVGASTSTYTEMVLENGSYNYRVRAMADGNYSTYSNSINTIVNITIPTDGLIAYYPFNGNANDESGNGHNGAVHGATLAVDRFNSINSTYSYDGADYVSIQDDNAFSFGMSPFTLCLWIKFDNIGSYHVMGHDSGEGNNPKWILWYTGYSIGVHEMSNAAYWIIESNWTPTINNWYQIIFTRDDNLFKIYINGVLQKESNDNRPMPDPNAPLTIGNAEGSECMFQGCIDDVRIYNQALSMDEIQALYHEGGWTGN